MATLTRMPTTTGRTAPLSSGDADDTDGTRGAHRNPAGIRLHRWAWGALAGYTAVVVALTCLKAWFAVGLLWKPENQRVRELRLQPFGIIDDASTTFGAAFDILGNIALFVPLGLIAVAATRRFWTTVVCCTAFSLCIEAAQYLFSLGRTDVTDLICNASGALAGALVSVLVMMFSPTAARRWTVVCATVVTVLVVGFAVLVVLGPGLAGQSVPVSEGPSF